MRHRTQLYAWLFTLLVICTACDRRTPSNVLSRSEMTEVLADYHLARAMVSNLDNDQRYKAPLIINGVFEKHGINKEVFDSSMVWYTRNPQDLAIIYGRVNNILQERIGSEDNRGAEFGEKKQRLSFSDPYHPGDSVSLWRTVSSFQMNRLLASRKEQFIISADTTFRPTDLIEWELNATFLPKNKQGGKALMYLMIRYASDSVIVSSRIIKENGKYSLTVRNNSGLEMRQIWGFIQYFPGSQTNDWQNKLFIDRIRLMRYRNKGNTSDGQKDALDSLKTESKPVDSLLTVPAARDSVKEPSTHPLPEEIRPLRGRDVMRSDSFRSGEALQLRAPEKRIGNNPPKKEK